MLSAPPAAPPSPEGVEEVWESFRQIHAVWMSVSACNLHYMRFEIIRNHFQDLGKRNTNSISAGLCRFKSGRRRMGTSCETLIGEPGLRGGFDESWVFGALR